MEAKIWYGGGDGYGPTGDVCGKRWRPWVNVKCWILFTSRWNPNFGSCLWVLNDFGIVLIGTVMASRLNWREGENVDPRARSAFTQRSAIQTWGKLGCRNAFGLPWAVTRRRVIWCQTNFTRSQLFAIYKLLRQQACRYSMLRCIKHWQDVRNHGCAALGVDHSLSNKLSRLM